MEKKGEDRVLGSLTSSNPAGVGAAPVCTRVASTWGRAWLLSHGYRQLAGKEKNRKSDLMAKLREVLPKLRTQSHSKNNFKSDVPTPPQCNRLSLQNMHFVPCSLIMKLR